MAEFWKSLPRKFCDICKCWFADNKASIDFHERGKRHQENAQKRIQDIQKRGIKDFKKQQQLENEMEKIEKAALAAYEKDLRNMEGGNTQPSIQPSQKIPYSAPVSNDKQPANKKLKKKQEISVKSSKQPEVEITPESIWYEGLSEDGYKYYWNSGTSESRWEAPEEGFISIEEQNQTNSEAVSTEQQSSEDTEKSVKVTESDSDEDDDVPCSIGPQPKVDPYGQWITVEKEEPVEYDLQLPAPSENAVEVVIPMHKEESLKFKEKIIGQLSDTEPGMVTFKKRKNAGSFKKNARQRFTDDD